MNIQETYPDACITYVIEQLGRKGNEGMKQFTQGSRSGTLDNGGLSDDVKSLLPLPSAKLLG